MKISRVEAIVLRLPEVRQIADGTQDALIVRVHTDGGLVGLGEVDSSPTVAKAAIEAPLSHSLCCGLGELILGQHPFEVEGLWEVMYRGSIFYGRRGAAIHAMSGIDIALWDIIGKACGKPIHKLLGGAYRDKVRAYASALMPETPQETAEAARDYVGRGFRAVKFGWGPLGTDPELDVALVEAARAGAGENVELMVDVGFSWKDATTAIQMARRIAPFRPFWIEEPLPPDDYDGYARLSQSVDIRIAAGEEESTCWGFQELIDRGKVDLIQPDVSRAGGLTECRRIAHLAQARNIPLVPHSWGTGILTAASLHLIATLPQALFLEHCVVASPIAIELVAEPPRVADGWAYIPQGPGLGVDIDEKVLERYAVK